MEFPKTSIFEIFFNDFFDIWTSGMTLEARVSCFDANLTRRTHPQHAESNQNKQLSRNSQLFWVILSPPLPLGPLGPCCPHVVPTSWKNDSPLYPPTGKMIRRCTHQLGTLFAVVPTNWENDSPLYPPTGKSDSPINSPINTLINTLLIP